MGGFFARFLERFFLRFKVLDLEFSSGIWREIEEDCVGLCCYGTRCPFSLLLPVVLEGWTQTSSPCFFYSCRELMKKYGKYVQINFECESKI